MTLTHTQHLALGALLLALAVLLVAVLWLRHLARNQHRRRVGQPPKSLAGHVATHPGKHLSALALALIGVALLVTAGTAAYVLLHHGGARFDPHKRVPPPRVQGGGGGVPPDWRFALPAADAGQGNTDACWAFSSTRALYAAYTMLGERPPAFSPWRTFWYGGGGQNVTNTMDGAVGAIGTYGLEAYTHWPVMGPPDALDEGYTLHVAGVSLHTIYYGAGYGISAVRAVESTLDAGHVVVALIDVHQDALQNGLPVWQQTGPHIFYHFIVVYGYRHLANGTDQLATMNSWGGAWGTQGDAFLGQGDAEASMLAAYTVLPTQRVPAWEPPAPPTSTPKPAPTSTPRPRATATPAPKPTACTVRRLTLKKGANLHTAARSSPVVAGVAKGQVVTTFCPAQMAPGWVRVRAGTHVGWLQTAAL